MQFVLEDDYKTKRKKTTKKNKFLSRLNEGVEYFFFLKKKEMLQLRNGPSVGRGCDTEPPPPPLCREGLYPNTPPM